MPKRVRGPFEQAGVRQVKLETLLCQSAASALCLGYASRRQGNINPSSKAVLQIPKGFAVANKHDFVHGLKINCRYESSCQTSQTLCFLLACNRLRAAILKSTDLQNAGDWPAILEKG